MEQLLPVQPATLQATPTAPSVSQNNSDQNSFSSHLNDALPDGETQAAIQDDFSDDTTPTENALQKNTNLTGNKTNNTQQEDTELENFTIASNQNTETPTAKGDVLNNLETTARNTLLPDSNSKINESFLLATNNKEDSTSLQVQSNPKTLQDSTTVDPTKLQQQTASVLPSKIDSNPKNGLNSSTNNHTNSQQGEDWNLKFRLNENIQNVTKSNLDLNITNSGESISKTPGTFSNQNVPNPLLTKIQQLIDKSNETGTVSIKASLTNQRSQYTNTTFGTSSSPRIPALNSEQNFLLSSLNTQGGAVLGTKFQFEDDFTLPKEPISNQLQSVRQNTQQQYYEAKMYFQGAENNDPYDQNGQNGQKEQNSSQPNATTFQVTNTTLTQESTTNFTQVTTSITDATAATLSQTDGSKSITSSQPTPLLHEENVLQQVIDRFHIHRKLQDTRINLKLHPAELGEVKIDLTVKEGSIRANVIAQSQHVQEIMEKNIGRLRTVLEDQGFTIDAISITSESDSVGDYDLFEKHYFSRNDYSPDSNTKQRGMSVVFPEEETTDPLPDQQGVNVKI